MERDTNVRDSIFSSSCFRQGSGERGAALVVVLSCLVLVSIVVVAFLTASATERASSRSYAEGGRARLIAQSAMDIVQGQIWAATTQTNASWASQPGAIRTFAAGSTNIANVFKLYSSGRMVADGSFNAGTTNAPTEIPADWASRPNQYVDLNLPVITSAGTNFPILDPRAKDTVTPTNSVAGFDYNASRGASQTNLPMPVQWMYQLKDGTLSSMSDAGKVAGAFTNNPIIGRLAFWADDDTCKININTAGEGVFWDIPRILNNSGNQVGDEVALSRFQPAQREYQRYPGHPFTTALSTVFPILTRAQIYALTPRVQDDVAGSNGGTAVPTAPLPVKHERLYASVDELLFSQGTATPRMPNLPVSAITPDAVSKLNFFLTASSRAPEINLYGKPRISMWPINSNPNYRTPIDKWFATCSTIGGGAFYFQRNDPTSPTNDYSNIDRNQKLFDYLQNLTSQSPPGWTSSFGAKFGQDRDQILTEIFDYIRCVNLIDVSDVSSSSNVRPFAMSTPVKVFDLINTAANFTAFIGNYGYGQVVPIKIGANKGFGRFPTITEATLVFFPMFWCTNANPPTPTNPVRQGEVADFTGNAPVVPLPGNPRMYRAMLILEPFVPAHGYVQYNQDYQVKVTRLSSIGVNGLGIGFPPTETSKAQGYINAVIGGSSMPSNAMMLSNPDKMTTNLYLLDGGNGRGTWPFLSAPFALPGPTNAGQQDGPANFTLDGGSPITVEIQNKSGEIIQTLSFSFPNGATLPTPAPTVLPKPLANQTDVDEAKGFRERLQWATQGTSFAILATDTAISVEPGGAYADYRLLSLLDNNSSTPNLFVPHQKVTDGSLTSVNNKATSMRNGFNDAFSYLGLVPQDTFGKYVKDIPAVVTSAFMPPDVPSSFNGVFNLQGDPGDWDTGVGNSRDGPYINKPDEGDKRVTGDAYFDLGGNSNFARSGLDTYFAPNRQVPSPGMLGSLPSRAKAGGPWETLLFNPNPAAGDNHRGFGAGKPNGSNPPDYLFLDLFDMPIIEPYAISEPFSTAGKINMNYQLVPFTYITRSTALRAALAANRVTAVHDSFASTYKKIPPAKSIRHKINADETLKQFEARFAAGDIFRSAAEICSIDLYPVVTAANRNTGAADNPVYSASRSAIKTWWSSRQLTGDNVREQPYTTLYQNLTTQSNTYTIHVWAQAIQKSPSSPVDEMTSKDTVSGEYRVAYSIERFIDPENPELKKPANDFALSTSPNANGFYQFRVNNTKQFLP